MTENSGPLVATVLKSFALITGILAFWRFFAAFTAPSVSFGGNEAISSAPSFFVQAGILTALALALWWMAETVSLLGRIAVNTEKPLSSLIADAFRPAPSAELPPGHSSSPPRRLSEK